MEEKIKLTQKEFDDLYEISDKTIEKPQESNANFEFEELITESDKKAEKEFLEENA